MEKLGYNTKYASEWQSHLQILFKILERFNETKIDGPVLVLDDDVEITSEFTE